MAPGRGNIVESYCDAIRVLSAHGQQCVLLPALTVLDISVCHDIGRCTSDPLIVFTLRQSTARQPARHVSNCGNALDVGTANTVSITDDVEAGVSRWANEMNIRTILVSS